MTAQNSINILFIHANNYDIGGSDYCLFKLVAALDRNRFNPLVLLGLETEIIEKYREHDIPVKIITMNRVRKTKNLLYQLKFVSLFFPTVLKILSLIRKYQIDIAHSNDFLDIHGPIAAKLAGVKSIQHDRLIMHRPVWIKKILCAMVEKLNNRIVVVSDGVARAMFSKNRRIHPKVVTCYDWLDMDIVGHSEGKGQFRKEIGVDEVKLKTAQVYEYENGNPLIPTIEKYSRYAKQRDGSYVVKNELLDHCWKLWHSCVITWDGIIVPCCFDKDAQHRLGDLKKAS